MVHSIKRSKGEEDLMKPFEDDMKRMGIETKDESEEDWLERQKKEYEQQAKEFIGMYKKAESIARGAKRVFRKGWQFVQE